MIVRRPHACTKNAAQRRAFSNFQGDLFAFSPSFERRKSGYSPVCALENEAATGSFDFDSSPHACTKNAAQRRRLVRAWGLEPQRLSAQEPKSCMSANFIMPALGKEKACCKGSRLLWSGQRGSNSLPPPWQGGALPDELCPRQHVVFYHIFLTCQELISSSAGFSVSSASPVSSRSSSSVAMPRIRS